MKLQNNVSINRKSIRQRGFVGIVFMAIALIGIVVAAIASMSRGSTAKEPQQKTTTAVVMKQAADLKTSFESFSISSGISPANITFDNNASTGLFNPSAKYAYIPNPPSQVIVGAGSPKKYFYRYSVKLAGYPAHAPSSMLVTLGDISLDACRTINNSIYGDPISQSPAMSGRGIAAWASDQDFAIDDSTVVAANYVGRPEGCVITNDGKYVYYKALAEYAGATVAVQMPPDI